MNTQLTTNDRQDFSRLDTTVTKGLATFIEVGQALAEIRARKLYREDHGTFEAYLSQRHEISRRQGYRLIEAAGVVDNLCPIGHTLPTNEAQCRELARIPAADVAEVWQTVVDDGEKITAELVRQHVDAYFRAIPPEYELHPACEIFPWMTDKEMIALAESIRRGGLIKPIALYDGRVLDGKLRLAACRMAGVEPRFIDVSDRIADDIGAMDYAHSMNACRAHYKPDQKAMALARLSQKQNTPQLESAI